MLSNDDVKTFLQTLPMAEQKILSALSSQEDWPVDDTDEIQPLLEKISEKLNDTEIKKTFSQVQPQILTGLMANLNMARYSIIMKEIASNKDGLSNALSEDACISEEDKVNRFTIYIRASYMVQYGLLQRIYSKERFEQVVKVLLPEDDDKTEEI